MKHVFKVVEFKPTCMLHRTSENFIETQVYISANYMQVHCTCNNNIKGAVRRKIFYLILILFRSTFHMRKNSILTKSISHHVPEIFRFL